MVKGEGSALLFVFFQNESYAQICIEYRKSRPFDKEISARFPLFSFEKRMLFL